MLFHQGERNEAGACAVPFLLEMLASPSTPDRAELIELLVALAVGYDDRWLPQGFDPSSVSPVELRVHSAVAEGAPLFAGLLEDDVAAVRRMAAYALGWFPGQVSPLAWALLDADESVAATAAIALGLAGEGHGLASEALGASLAGPRPLLRGASAIGLARLLGRASPAEVADELRRWAGEGVTSEVPFLGGALSGHASLALGTVVKMP